eukprot:9045098-Alexandrium_andersonii.AAC.1
MDKKATEMWAACMTVEKKPLPEEAPMAPANICHTGDPKLANHSNSSLAQSCQCCRCKGARLSSMMAAKTESLT